LVFKNDFQLKTVSLKKSIERGCLGHQIRGGIIKEQVEDLKVFYA
jgi:hypothetical protein